MQQRQYHFALIVDSSSEQSDGHRPAKQENKGSVYIYIEDKISAKMYSVKNKMRLDIDTLC